jgi:hypothetical protein
VEYKRVQEHTAWLSYLDRQQEQTSTVDDESEKWRSSNGWKMKNIQEINCYLLYAVNVGDITNHSNCLQKQQLRIHKNRRTLCYLPSKALSHPYYIPELV